MHVPAWPVLPSSTLAQNEIAEKFNVPSLMGFGSFCDDFPDECGMDTSVLTTDPNSTALPYFLETGAQGWPATPTGTAVNVPTNKGTVTYINQGTAAAPNYMPVFGAAVAGAIDIAKLLTIQSGTVQQGGTTLKQNPGYAVPTPNTNTGLKLTTNSSSTILIAAAVGVGVLLMMQQGRR